MVNEGDNVRLTIVEAQLEQSACNKMMVDEEKAARRWNQ